MIGGEFDIVRNTVEISIYIYKITCIKDAR